jgi:hypothetical protein
VWKKPLDGAFVPQISHDGLQIERQAILDAFKRTGKDMKREGGIDLLQGAEREACVNLFSTLSDYGIFVVPTGELESWMANLQVSRNKSSWLFEVFQSMGDDPDDPNYINPEKDDVWDFIGGIGEWLKNEKRKGIPK